MYIERRKIPFPSIILSKDSKSQLGLQAMSHVNLALGNLESEISIHVHVPGHWKVVTVTPEIST